MNNLENSKFNSFVASNHNSFAQLPVTIEDKLQFFVNWTLKRRLQTPGFPFSSESVIKPIGSLFFTEGLNFLLNVAFKELDMDTIDTSSIGMRYQSARVTGEVTASETFSNHPNFSFEYFPSRGSSDVPCLSKSSPSNEYGPLIFQNTVDFQNDEVRFHSPSTLVNVHRQANSFAPSSFDAFVLSAYPNGPLLWIQQYDTLWTFEGPVDTYPAAGEDCPITKERIVIGGDIDGLGFDTSKITVVGMKTDGF